MTQITIQLKDKEEETLIENLLNKMNTNVKNNNKVIQLCSQFFLWRVFIVNKISLGA